MSRFGLRTSLRSAGALAGVLALGALLPTGASAMPQEVREELREAEAPVGSLGLDNRVTLEGGATVYRFDQEREGIPVEGGEAIVLDAAGEGAEIVADETEAGIAAPAEPAIAASRAIRIAVDAIGSTAFGSPPEAELVIDPTGDGTLAWRVSVPSDKPLGDFEVLVDAASGAVLEQRDLTWRATGEAKLFEPNAVVENGGYGIYGSPVGSLDPEGTYRIRDKHDRDSRALSKLRSPATLRHMNEKRPCLKGRYAEARLGSRERRVCRASRDWTKVTRGRNRFEALMAYYHVDQAQEYLLENLGVQDVEDERQMVVANSFGGDNSFYLPGRDAIKLGTGGVDDGEDADVIVHEYGHAIQDTQVKGFGDGPQAGAIGEGWGDYFAEGLAAELWGDGPFPACVMEWDAVSYDVHDAQDSPGICLRRTDVPRTLAQQRDFCDDDGQGRHEIHCVGEVWSSALWSLRSQAADGSDIDHAVVASHTMYTVAESFDAAARALVAADGSVNSGANCTAIVAEMDERGFFGKDPPPAC